MNDFKEREDWNMTPIWRTILNDAFSSSFSILASLTLMEWRNRTVRKKTNVRLIRKRVIEPTYGIVRYYAHPASAPDFVVLDMEKFDLDWERTFERVCEIVQSQVGVLEYWDILAFRYPPTDREKKKKFFRLVCENIIRLYMEPNPRPPIRLASPSAMLRFVWWNQEPQLPRRIKMIRAFMIVGRILQPWLMGLVILLFIAMFAIVGVALWKVYHP